MSEEDTDILEEVHFIIEPNSISMATPMTYIPEYENISYLDGFPTQLILLFIIDNDCYLGLNFEENFYDIFENWLIKNEEWLHIELFLGSPSVVWECVENKSGVLFGEKEQRIRCIEALIKSFKKDNIKLNRTDNPLFFIVKTPSIDFSLFFTRTKEKFDEGIIGFFDRRYKAKYLKIYN